MVNAKKASRWTWPDQQRNIFLCRSRRKTRADAVQPARASTPVSNSNAIDHSTKEQTQAWPRRARHRQARPWYNIHQATTLTRTYRYQVASKHTDPQPKKIHCSSNISGSSKQQRQYYSGAALIGSSQKKTFFVPAVF